MRKMTWGIFFAAMIVAPFTAGSVTAQDGGWPQEEIIIYLNQIQIVPAHSPTRVIIGNPDIADVSEVTKTEVTLSAVATGSTALVIKDALGEHSYQVQVYKEDMGNIKRRIDSLLTSLNYAEVTTKAQNAEAKVLLLGKVKTTADRERIMTALGPLTEKAVDLITIEEEEAIVDIDVQVLELNKDGTKTLGVSLPGAITLTELGSLGQPNTSINTSGTVSGSTTGAKWSTLFSILNLSRTAFSATLDMLIQDGKARVLSRPRLACQSNKEAELLVGGEKPIMTTQVASSGGSGTDVEYKEFGIKLKIKPTVTDKDKIKMAVYVEVSEVGTAEILGTSTEPTARAYPLSKRNASTELILNDGQTLAIGGLIRQKTEEDVRKVPWLGDIPILGAAFRQKTTRVGGGEGERGDSELVITLTPSLVTGKEKTQAQSQAQDPAQIQAEPLVTAAPVRQEASLSALERYGQIIQKRILGNTQYPEQAKQAGFQGTVKLAVKLSYQGQLLETVIKESSGYKILDDQATGAAQATAMYPPFPPSISEQELWIDVPVVYSLQ